MQVDINSGIDFDELDALVAEDPPRAAKPLLRREARRERPAANESDLPVAGTLFWRFIKNTAPQLTADVLALMVSGLLAALLLRLVADNVTLRWSVAAVAAIPLVFAYWLRGLYSGIGVHPVTELRDVFQLNTITLGAVTIATILEPHSSLWCAFTWAISIGLVPLLRGFVRRWCAHRSWWGYPTLIISAGEYAHAIADMLARAPASGLRPMLLTDPTGECSSPDFPVEYDADKVEQFVRRNAISHAVLWLPDLQHNQLPAMVERYSRVIPHLLIASDSAALPTFWHATRSCGPFTATEVRNGHMLAPLQWVKRSIDIMIAGIALLLSAPCLLVIALVVKLGSKGPIFFGHTRIGVNGKRFKAWKFRTMFTHGDSLLERHLSQDEAAREEWERDQKLRDDPRVTPLGGLLRRWSLDELPQAWNVLKGDMSIVGPRPIVHGEAGRYGDVFDLYTSVKPGITGLWQVSGRNNTTYDERVRFDAYYVRNWSPWLDVYILIKTVVTLVCRTGAC